MTTPFPKRIKEIEEREKAVESEIRNGLNCLQPPSKEIIFLLEIVKKAISEPDKPADESFNTNKETK